MSSSYLLKICTLSSVLLLGAMPALADMPKTNINGLLSYQYILEENEDLSTSNLDTAESHSLHGRLYIKSQFSPNTRSFIDIKGLRINGDTGAEEDTGTATSLESYLELRQAWIEHKMWGGSIPLSYKIGRQRLKEKSTLWWNRDMDAIKISYDTSLFKTHIAFGENLGSYRTVNDDFLRDDEKRFRIMGQSEWQWAYQHFITLRGHFENDHSGVPSIGQNVPINDLDTVDMRLLWLGVDTHGTYTPKKPTPYLKNIHYQAQAMYVTGREYLTQTAFIPLSNFRNVTGIDKQNVRGWAIDTSMQVAIDAPHDPILTVGYAYGSGDDDTSDRTDYAFRQTDMNGNSNLPFGAGTSIRKYGDVLRPELSNLHILTVGGSIDILKSSQLHVIGHYYHLDHKATSLRSSGISAALDRRHKSVGFGTDFVVDYRLSDEWQGIPSLLGQSKIKLSLGHFIAGSAYGTAEGDQTLRAYSELQIRF